MAAFENLSVKISVPVASVDRNGVRYPESVIDKAAKKFTQENKPIPLTAMLPDGRRITIGEVNTMVVESGNLVINGSAKLGGTCEEAEIGESVTNPSVISMSFVSAGFVSTTPAIVPLGEAKQTVLVAVPEQSFELSQENLVSLKSVLALSLIHI